MPPATAKPSIAAISGLREARWAIPAKPRSPNQGDSPLTNAPRSMPAQKNPPAPVSTPTDRPSSSSSSSRAPATPAATAALTAFRTSGRLSVISSTFPRRSVRTARASSSSMSGTMAQTASTRRVVCVHRLGRIHRLGLRLPSLRASRNSRIPLPRARASSGRRLGPSTISATAAMNSRCTGFSMPMRFQRRASAITSEPTLPSDGVAQEPLSPAAVPTRRRQPPSRSGRRRPPFSPPSACSCCCPRGSRSVPHG